MSYHIISFQQISLKSEGEGERINKLFGFGVCLSYIHPFMFVERHQRVHE